MAHAPWRSGWAWGLCLALLTLGCGATAPAPAPAAPSEAPPPTPRPWRALRVAALEAARAADPSVPWPDVWGAPWPAFSPADVAAVGTLCGEVVDEGLSSADLGCAAFQQQRFAARPAFDPGAVADRARLEVLGLGVLLRYAARAQPGLTVAEGAGEGAGAQPASAWVIDRVGQQPVAEMIGALRPAGDQYLRLMAAARRYRQLAAEGPWPRVPLGHFKRGQRGPGVAALRARLAREGFDSPATAHPDRFDGGLFQALGRFQVAHQLPVTPVLGRATRRALGRTAAQKLAQIHGALAAWRAAPRRGPGGLWVQINLPDYHGEVWRDGARIHRFRVIVGDDTADDTGRLRNATPTLSSAIHEVVYRPDWRVPQRILEDEILPQALEQAGFQGLDARLAARGFEVMHKGTAAEHVRQRPGRGNPLGDVKFRFPNRYAVYLHDTPRRSLFRRPTRALSHGCVRVDQPLHLARLLLEHDGRYDPAAIRGWLADDEPHTVRLTRPVPVFLDYVTVRVDDAGQPQFLDDIYGRAPVRGPR